MKREILTDRIVFNTINVSKFKTTRISLFAYVPMKKETAYLNNLVSKVLTRSCEKYPDFTLLSKKLSSLYGASLDSTVSKVGDRQVIAFHIVGLDDRYTFDKEVLSKELATLLCNIIFMPKIIDGVFDIAEVEQVKREALETIDSEFNEKRIYAFQQAIHSMCKDEAFGLPRLGTKEQVESATSESIYNAWQELLKKAKFEVFYTGDSDSQFAKEIFIEQFKQIECEKVLLDNTIVRKASNVSEVSEHMELAQSKMILGFRTDCAEPNDNTYVTKLMCAILGGTAHSKLFNNVREKLSLCYYCMSKYIPQKGIMLVESGVEKDNIEKAKEAILNEIEDIKKGNVTDFEIDSTKLSITNAFRESTDLSSGVEGWYSAQVFNSEIYDVEQACKIINKITKDEIVEAANKLTLDTIYTLVGTEGAK